MVDVTKEQMQGKEPWHRDERLDKHIEIKTGEVVIIDDFLEPHHHKEMQEVIGSKIFPWYFNPVVTADQKPSDPPFMLLGNLLYNQASMHIDQTFFKVCYPLLDKIQPRALIRVKVNMFINVGSQPGRGVEEHAIHNDYPWPHRGCLYHLNSNDGYTKLGTQKIESVANRAVMFDPGLKHCSTSCSDKQQRLNIQINYF